MTTDHGETLPPPSVRAPVLSQGEPLETLCGVPLEAGERVVAFVRPSHRKAKIAFVIAAVLLMPLLVGIPLLFYALLYERWQLAFAAVTTRRTIAQVGLESPRWLYHEEVTALRSEGARHRLVIDAKERALVIENAEASARLAPLLERARADRVQLAAMPSAAHPS